MMAPAWSRLVGYIILWFAASRWPWG